MIILRQDKIYILELSGGGVKLLTCPGSYTRDLGKFLFRYIDSKTNEGLRGGKMDIEYFKKEVCPKIQEITAGIEQDARVICVATAWARASKNIQDVQELVPWKINILSGQEEAEMALKGYLNTAKRDLRKYKYIVSLDFGSKSTEVKVLGGQYISMQNGNPQDFKKFDKEFEWLKNEDSVLVVTTGKRFLKSTGKATLQDQHDTELNLSDLQWHGGIQRVMKTLGENHTLVTNGAPLSFGVYYKTIGK